MIARVGVERRPLGIADYALAAWIAILAAVTVYGAATTEGFLTVSNMKAILTAASFVGIIAVGLTVIVLSGSLFSLALGQTAAVSAMFFLYSVRWGLGAAIILTLLLGLAIGAVQGFAVGAWGANPIIITIGAAGLLEGMAVWLSHGQSIVPPDNRTSWEHLANPVLGLPAPVYVFIAVSILLGLVMRRTRFGRQIYLLGENRVAARRVMAGRYLGNPVVAEHAPVRDKPPCTWMLGIGAGRHRPGSVWARVPIPTERKLDEGSGGCAMEIGSRMVAGTEHVIDPQLFLVYFGPAKANLPPTLKEFPAALTH